MLRKKKEGEGRTDAVDISDSLQARRKALVHLRDTRGCHRGRGWCPSVWTAVLGPAESKPVLAAGEPRSPVPVSGCGTASTMRFSHLISLPHAGATGNRIKGKETSRCLGDAGLSSEGCFQRETGDALFEPCSRSLSFGKKLSLFNTVLT